MDILGPTGTYLLIVALAAFAVGVHAYSMYGQRVPLEKDSAVRDPLNALTLPTVAGQNAFRRGFAAYLLANELLYFLLISSSIILELSLNAIGKAELVGALSSDNPLNTIVPILASTVVITASQLRPFSRIEHSIRSVAHRIAGIPRNLDSVQEQIRLTSIDDIGRDEQASVHSCRLIDNARERAGEVYQAAKVAGLGEFEANNLRTSLIRVHCLYEWTLGYDGEQIWISDEVKQITTLFESLKLEFRSFKSNVARLQGEAAVLPGSASGSHLELWEKVVSDCLMLERRLTVVLSLLLINKPDVELHRYTALAYLRDKTVDDGNGADRGARNALGVSVLFGSLVGFVSMIAYLSLEKTYRDWGQMQADELMTKAPFGVPAAERSASDALQYFSARMDNAFFETLDFTLIFAVSIWIALIMRDALFEQKRWPKMKPGDIAPVGLYLYIGLLAYIPSVLLFLVLKFLVLMVISPLRAGLEILDPVSLKTFPGYLPEIILVPCISFVCVWFICTYLDQDLYKRRNATGSILKYAAACGGLNFLLASLRGNDMNIDDAFAAFFIPALVIYALLSVMCRAYRRQWVRRRMGAKASEDALEKLWRVFVERVFAPLKGSLRKTADREPSKAESGG
ncbi:hypothetical protein ACUNV4_22830 [Granulosicoccus sp. 3-233]|uniref:hypothetical protein n=1 Tax=Granulosicoccus sp. 3-233 TaxID=3417969 RepID=UPI003D354531